MAGAELILVRHSLPVIAPDTPAKTWRLSAEGERRCGWLAEALAARGVERLAASAEPKAARTAELVAARLGLEVRIQPGLHEHDRTGIPFVSREAFERDVAAFFARPDELVFGRETARQALRRFAAAVDAVLAGVPGTTAVVAHGTVLALFAAVHDPELDPFALWSALTMPSFVVLERPGFGWDGVIHSHPEVASGPGPG